MELITQEGKRWIDLLLSGTRAAAESSAMKDAIAWMLGDYESISSLTFFGKLKAGGLSTEEVAFVNTATESYQYFYTKNTCARNHYVNTCSATLFSTVYPYLWGVRGRDVCIKLSKENSTSSAVSSLSDLADAVREKITEDNHLNEVITTAIRNAIDYGQGYVVFYGGHMINVHPTQVYRIQTPSGFVYFVAGSKSMMVFSKKEFLMGQGVLRGGIEKKYVFCEFDYSNNRLKDYTEHDHMPILELTMPFDTRGFGCGANALEFHKLSNEALNSLYTAQKNAINPPVVVPAEVLKQVSDNGGVSGGDMLVGSFQERTTQQFVQTRPDIGETMMNFWNQSIARSYFLDRIANPETAQSLLSGSLSNFYDGFLFKLLRVYFGKDGAGKKVFKEKGAEVKDYRFYSVGNYAGLLANNTTTAITTVLKMASALSQIDQRVVMSINALKVMETLAGEIAPEDWIASEEDVQKLASSIRQAQTSSMGS